MRFFEKTLFFLLLTSIPIQLGRHFWPSFSFVQGIRVDYLSPTIYVSDIILVALISVSLPRLYEKFGTVASHYLVLFTFGSLLLSTMFAVDIQAAVFGDLKFLEFFYLAFYVAQIAGSVKNWSPYVFTLTLGALVESVIVVFQFASQHSLGGFFYFLGERTFSASTPGIAVFQTNSELFLRPYGTFPHPNLVGFFFLFAFVFLIFFPVGRNSRLLLLVKFIALAIISFGIFITFSRTVIILLVLLLIYFFFSHVKVIRRGLVLLISIVFCFVAIVLSLVLFQRFATSIVRDLMLRFDLIKISLLIISQNLLLGTGLNNFFLHEIVLQKSLTPTLLQPVHNIYLLWITQTGILGLVTLINFLIKAGKNIYILWKGRFEKPFMNNTTLVLAVSVLMLGLFDHYFLTLQQGQLIFAIVIGLIFSIKKINGLGLV